jgi:hypothetical protein
MLKPSPQELGLEEYADCERGQPSSHTPVIQQIYPCSAYICLIRDPLHAVAHLQDSQICSCSTGAQYVACIRVAGTTVLPQPSGMHASRKRPPCGTVGSPMVCPLPHQHATRRCADPLLYNAVHAPTLYTSDVAARQASDLTPVAPVAGEC